MRDLEIRGAGSILGTAQSGHIVAVGFDLYCQLLKQAVAQLKGEKLRLRLEVDRSARFRRHQRSRVRPARRPEPTGARPLFPSSYIGDTTLRIQAYRRPRRDHDAASSWNGFEREWRDRFGQFPPRG